MGKNDKDINKIEENINSLTDTLEKLTSSLGPMMNFSDLNNTVNKLKDSMPKPISEDEGETCIHGNAWHSECSDCNSESLVDDMFKLIESTPNDSELGAKVRELYNTYINSDDIED